MAYDEDGAAIVMCDCGQRLTPEEAWDGDRCGDCITEARLCRQEEERMRRAQVDEWAATGRDIFGR